MFRLAISGRVGHSVRAPMKKISFLAAALITLGLTPAFAQFGPRGGAQGPQFGGAMDKLFGDHPAFSAVLEFQTSQPGGEAITVPGKFNFDGGKSRFEMNLTETRGTQMPPGAAEHMKAMGMDTVISISRPDRNRLYLVYPGLNSYVEMASPNAVSNSTPDDFKVETEALGKENVDGHDCVKNKVTVTDKEGARHLSTVWNATDLKNFPVKIVTTEPGRGATMLFKTIAFTKPDAATFEPPAGCAKYDNLQTLMMTEIAKHMGGMGMPPQGN